MKKPQDTEPKKVKSFEEVRQEFPRTHEQWNQDEDEHLKQQFENGLSLSELAIFFERNAGAIRSRLIKLSLIY